jgi:hypothetical protein
MLIKRSDSTAFRRIFTKFNKSVLDFEPTPNSGLIIDKGNYASELEDFEAALDADESIVDMGVDATTVSPRPSPSPLQSRDHGTPIPAPPTKSHVSITITSNVSSAIAESSQTFNVAHPDPTAESQPLAEKGKRLSPRTPDTVDKIPPTKVGARTTRATRRKANTTVPTNEEPPRVTTRSRR